MKVHLVGSITGNQKRYKQIIDTIEEQGHTIVTYHFATRTLADIAKETPDDTEIYRRNALKWIKQADVIIFEATTPSIGTGYELALSVDFKKPVIILYEPNEQNAPHPMLSYNERIQVIPYSIDDLRNVLADALEISSKHMEVRFTLILPGEIVTYLDEVAKNGKTKSDYLRDLIKKDMKKE